MNDGNTLLTVLADMIGLTLLRQRQAIVSYGFDTCNGLMSTSVEDLRSLFSTIARNNRGLLVNQQARLNLTVKSRMYALCKEFVMRSQCNAEMGLNMLVMMNTQVVNTFVAKHKAWQIAKDAAATSSLSKIEVPKLTKKNCKEFHCALIETFGRQRGVSLVPLSYVIRANEVNDYELAYKSTKKQL